MPHPCHASWVISGCENEHFNAYFLEKNERVGQDFNSFPLLDNYLEISDSKFDSIRVFLFVFTLCCYYIIVETAV